MQGLSDKPPPGGPIDVMEAAALFRPLRPAGKLLIGVSGGPDSIALMHLAARAARQGLLPLIVVATVDHGLQPASADVAAGVIAEAERLGLDAHRLRWEGPKPSTGLQAAARRERYRLLDDLARRLEAPHLATAHTLDDQAETILFRMARGSGPAGLAGMRPSVTRDGLVHHRPFLGLPKRRITETCTVNGWRFVEDTANRDPRFARARLRGLLPSLADEGLDARTFATLGRRLARDEDAFGTLAAELLHAVLLPGPGDIRRLDASALLGRPAALVVRAMERALTDFARPGPPRLSRVERLEGEMRRAHAGRQAWRRTLHGHVVTLTRRDQIDIAPEGPRKRGGTPAGKDA